jgi:hypothetical protein
VAPLTTQNSGPTRQLDPRLEPGRELFEGPVVDADLAAAAALAAPYQQRAATRVQVGLGERERLADAQAGAPQHDDQAAQAAAVNAVAGAAHDGHDLLDRRRIRRVAHSLVARRAAGVGTPAAWQVSDGGRRHRATAQTWPLLGHRKRTEAPLRGGPPRTVTAAQESAFRSRATPFAPQSQSSSAVVSVSTNTGMPQRMEGDSRAVTAALHGCRSEVGVAPAPPRARCSSVSTASGRSNPRAMTAPFRMATVAEHRLALSDPRRKRKRLGRVRAPATSPPLG